MHEETGVPKSALSPKPLVPSTSSGLYKTLQRTRWNRYIARSTKMITMMMPTMDK